MKTDSNVRDKNCVFCKIIAREEPASFVYEDDHIVGFLNNRPPHAGECLLIPKVHIDHFTDLDENIAMNIMAIGQRLARKIKDTFNPERVGYVVSGFGIPHAHLIIVPLHHHQDITSRHYAFLKDGEIHYSEQQIPLVDRGELDRISALIRLD